MRIAPLVTIDNPQTQKFPSMKYSIMDRNFFQPQILKGVLLYGYSKRNKDK